MERSFEVYKHQNPSQIFFPILLPFLIPFHCHCLSSDDNENETLKNSSSMSYICHFTICVFFVLPHFFFEDNKYSNIYLYFFI